MRLIPSPLDEVVVRPKHSPRRRLFVAAAAVLTLLLIGGVIFRYGLNSAGFNQSAFARAQESLQADMRKVQEENKSLRDALARAELALQMDQTAYRDLDRALKSSAAEITSLREELRFYRNIISPDNKTAGLQIQRLDIGPPVADGVSFKLVLIQALKHDRNVAARVSFEITGQQDGKQASIAYPSVDKPIMVNFKYFQDVTGKWPMPAAFVPERVKVSVVPAGSDTAIERLYPWPGA